MIAATLCANDQIVFQKPYCVYALPELRWRVMNAGRKSELRLTRIIPICAAFAIVSVVILLSDYFYWRNRFDTQNPKPVEAKVMTTGTLRSTNGWGFELRKVINFGRRQVNDIVFCKKTRQLFVSFGDGTKNADHPIVQWDLDSAKQVTVFHFDKEWQTADFAISPDGSRLVVELQKPYKPDRRTLVMDVTNRSLVRDLGDIGSWTSWNHGICFNRDGSALWLSAFTVSNWDRGVALKLDETIMKEFSMDEFPKTGDARIWDVPCTKERVRHDGLYFKDASGNTRRLTQDYWGGNYAVARDGHTVVAASWHDDIVAWDGRTGTEIARQRITDHHNGAGFVIYDEVKDRFLIADPSPTGVKYLRALVVTKQPND